MTNNHTWHTLASADVATVLEVVVHWAPAQAIFSTTDLEMHDWIKAMDEAGKLMMRLPPRDPHAGS